MTTPAEVLREALEDVYGRPYDDGLAALDQLLARIRELEAENVRLRDQRNMVSAELVLTTNRLLHERDRLRADLAEARASGGRCVCGHLNESCLLPALSHQGEPTEGGDR